MSLQGLHIIIKILEEYKNQPKSLLRLLLAAKRNKLGLKGAAEVLRSKDDLLSIKKELAIIKLETGQKMIENASLELKQIPGVRPRVSQGPLRYGSYHNYSHLPDEWRKVITTVDYLPPSLLFG